MIFPGWTIERAVPYRYLAGLMTGQYSLTGGVIRQAAGSADGGQIVAHLLPAASNFIPGLDFIPGLIANFQLHHLTGAVSLLGTKITSLGILSGFNSYQLMRLSSQVNSLSEATHNVMQFAAGAALMSGLGLAVSSVGFLVVNKKLNRINLCLQAIQKDVKEIRQFLELGEHAELMAALKDLLNVNDMITSSVREKILSDRRQTLMKINERYRTLLSQTTELSLIAPHEEYFALTALAATRCTAELGMASLARKEMEALSQFWHEQAKRITKEVLIGRFPERFIASDFAEDVPLSALVEWLDFGNDQKKGYEWIDDIRKKIDEPWYRKSWQSLTSGGGLNRAKGVGMEKEKNVVIPTLQKFVARSNVLEGYIAQYKMLEQNEMKPSQFEQKILDLPPEQAVDGFFILQPPNPLNKFFGCAPKNEQYN